VELGLPYSLVQEAISTKRGVLLRFSTNFLPESNAVWHRPDLARTLDRLAIHGWRDFYDAKIGHTIADFVRSQGGILTRQDMADFSPRVTEPCSGTYRDVTIHTAIAPNGGF